MFSAIKSFAKRNRVLFILLIVAVSITLSYYISYDIPELISGIEKWYKLFSDLSIGVIINFIFYVFQVYIPRREEEKATLRIIDPDLTKICQGIQEILLVAQTYLPGFEKGKIHIAESSVYYMKMTTADAGEGWTRHFDLYKDFSQLKKGVVETTDRLLSSALLQGCDKEVVELLGKLQRNGFLQALEAAENNKFDPDCYYTDFENSFGYEKYPVFCLFCCDERNCGNYQVDKGVCVIPVSFSAEQVRKLKTALGTYALIILDTDEFLTRVDKAFCQENISYMKSCNCGVVSAIRAMKTIDIIGFFGAS